MTTPEALSARLAAHLDAVPEPVSIASSIRDRDGRILDFRIEYANVAAAQSVGLPREAMIGLMKGEVFADLRSSGLFDSLREVVETGRPYRGRGASGPRRDLRAIRLGDGYLGTWRAGEPPRKRP